jgi:hypothetical protein
MSIKLALGALFVCPHRLRSLSVIATDVLALKRGFKLENPARGFVAVGRPQFSAGAIAIGVDGAHPDRQLPRDLFRGEMAVDKGENLAFALGQKPKLIWPFRRIRSAAHIEALARLQPAAHAACRAVPPLGSVETDVAST